jgi:hypothetical protein
MKSIYYAVAVLIIMSDCNAQDMVFSKDVNERKRTFKYECYVRIFTQTLTKEDKSMQQTKRLYELFRVEDSKPGNRVCIWRWLTPPPLPGQPTKSIGDISINIEAKQAYVVLSTGKGFAIEKIRTDRIAKDVKDKVVYSEKPSDIEHGNLLDVIYPPAEFIRNHDYIINKIGIEEKDNRLIINMDSGAGHKSMVYLLKEKTWESVR